MGEIQEGESKALAAVTTPEGHTAVRSYSLPEVTERTGILRVEASGVCGTDISLSRHGALTGSTILGHHITGRIAAVGDEAAARWGVASGDLVAVQEYLPCHACRWCRGGEFRFCDCADIRQGGRRFGTVSVDEPPSLWGGNGQFLYLPSEALVHRLPETMTARRAVWLLPLANAFDWTLQAGALHAGDVVVIVGPGQHGLTCVVAAQQMGAGTIVLVGTDDDEDRLAVGASLGAHQTVATSAPSAVKHVRDLLGGGRADLVINTSGASQLVDLVAMAGKGGRVVESTLAQDCMPVVDMEAVTSRAIAVVGARGRGPTAVRRAIDSLGTAEAEHPVDKIPSRAVGLAEVDEILRPVETGAGQRAVHTVVRPWLDA